MSAGARGRLSIPRCNLCSGYVVRIFPGLFGRRCLRCASTYIHRAICAVIAELDLPASSRVYELSSRGPFVRFLRRRFLNLTLSEYFDDVSPGGWKRGVQCQNVEKLTYPDSAFDLVTSTEVFEHVADDRRGFAEVARVLAPGGWFVFTVPLADRLETLERARVVAGRVEHLQPPEYHGDRLRGMGRVLAFRTYGRDIVERLGEAGLEAEIRTFDDPARGIVPAAPVVVARR